MARFLAFHPISFPTILRILATRMYFLTRFASFLQKRRKGLRFRFAQVLRQLPDEDVVAIEDFIRNIPGSETVFLNYCFPSLRFPCFSNHFVRARGF
jgi:hypothetical protein